MSVLAALGQCVPGGRLSIVRNRSERAVRMGIEAAPPAIENRKAEEQACPRQFEPGGPLAGIINGEVETGMLEGRSNRLSLRLIIAWPGGTAGAGAGR